MKNLTRIVFAFILIASGCKSKRDSFDITEDGTYCAYIEYYNPNTGTKSNYILNIEVESQVLIRILWPNGGWLDDDHFSSVYFDETGYAKFTSDKGYEYTIEVNGPECTTTDANKMDDEVKGDAEQTICPKCGDEKDQYDKLCSKCKRNAEEEEDKKERTCPKCGQYNYTMHSYDDQCSDCERKEREEKERKEDEEKKKHEEE